MLKEGNIDEKNIIIAILSVIILISISINIVTLYSSNIHFTNAKEGSITKKYDYMLDGYIPDSGYVPDAVSAAKIGKVIFETMLNETGGHYIVEYDDEEQLWIVRNVSVFRNGGVVIIQKSDGKIIRAWGNK